MKATVLQENLQKALSKTQKFLSTKTQIPILNNVLLRVSKGQLKISATNLETAITISLGAPEEEEGETTVPARILTELVTAFTHEKVELAQKDQQLFVTCGRSEAKLATQPASEFPPLAEENEKPDMILKASIFTELSRVLFSASSDESRPLLTGVQFAHKEGALVIAATDGYRLSVETNSEEKGIDGKVVMPSRVLSELGRLIVEEKTDVVGATFYKDKNQVVFSLPHTTLTTRLIEGDFPPYEKIIPSETTTKAVFEREEFLKAVKLASVFAREASNVIRFKITPNEVIVSANTPQTGENKTSVSAVVEGEDVEVAMNSRFLLDVLSQLSSKQIVFETKGALSPGVFKIPDQPSYLHIIMPVRVQE